MTKDVSGEGRTFLLNVAEATCPTKLSPRLMRSQLLAYQQTLKAKNLADKVKKRQQKLIDSKLVEVERLKPARLHLLLGLVEVKGLKLAPHMREPLHHLTHTRSLEEAEVLTSSREIVAPFATKATTQRTQTTGRLSTSVVLFASFAPIGSVLSGCPFVSSMLGGGMPLSML